MDPIRAPGAEFGRHSHAPPARKLDQAKGLLGRDRLSWSLRDGPFLMTESGDAARSMFESRKHLPDYLRRNGQGGRSSGFFVED